MNFPKVLSIRLCLLLLLMPALALAASSYQHAEERSVPKAPQDVLKVLVAYDKTCDKGCAYKAPHVKETKRLAYKNGKTHWYTWQFVDHSLKSIKYFSEVSLQGDPTGSYQLIVRQLNDSDKPLIATLEKKSGLRHAPSLDSVLTVTSVKAKASGSTVDISTKIQASGMMTMFGSAIRSSMKKGVEATFNNLNK
ncbi:MAG: hypothetical protein MK135_12710 [Polyangiaceae bacterium]|nr:hypothetical protein [Polyangiaceae bacterium]